MVKSGDVTRYTLSNILAHIGVVALAAVVGIAIVLTVVAPAQAITVDAYQKWRLSRQTVRATPTGIMEIRLHGVLRGLLIANAALAKQGSALLFCVPKGMSMKATELRKAIDAELKSPSNPEGKPYLSTQSIDKVVLIVARRKWPCGKSGRGMKEKTGGERER